MSNGKKPMWKSVVKDGRIALRSPDGRHFFGTPAEVRACALMPWQRDMLAQSLKLMRDIHQSGTFTDEEFSDVCARERRDMIRYCGKGKPLPASVEIPPAVYIRLCAGARLVADNTEDYFGEMWNSELEALLDVAQNETGKREIPLTRHERAALARCTTAAKSE